MIVAVEEGVTVAVFRKGAGESGELVEPVDKGKTTIMLLIEVPHPYY